MATDKQKMDYVKRHIDILTVEHHRNIYNMIRSSSANAIRDGASIDAIYVDLQKIDLTILNSIYNIIKLRKEEIKI